VRFGVCAKHPVLEDTMLKLSFYLIMPFEIILKKISIFYFCYSFIFFKKLIIDTFLTLFVIRCDALEAF
jgi:hypothetical protein